MKILTSVLVAVSLFTGISQAGQFGTGFAVSPLGFFVTCNHVVSGSDHIIVHCADGALPARVIAADPENDLAVLHVIGWNGKFLGLKSATSLEYAAQVTVAGYPDPTVMGRNPKVSKGIVNALSGVRDDPRLIQVSAPVQPGNSGGPLVNETGQVVGVVAAGINSIDRMENGGYVPQAVNYAVKTDLVVALLDQYKIPHPSFATKTNGESRMIRRVMSSIGLVEAVSRGQRSSLIPPAGAARETRQHPQATLLTKNSQPFQKAWVFEHSHSVKLMPSEVERLPQDALWRARNEIYLRRGYIFSTEKGRRFAQKFGGLYRPVTTSADVIKSQLNEAEVHNLRLIASFEEMR